MSADGSLLAQERRDAILGLLLERSQVRVAELADALRVSEMTVRRDLNRLADDRLVEKVHGGAVLPRRQAREPHFAATRRLNAATKAAIARAAARRHAGPLFDPVTAAGNGFVALCEHWPPEPPPPRARPGSSSEPSTTTTSRP
jgi:DNA-binding GntR family transcriptional regulator